MSKGKVEIARRGIDAFNRGDVEAFAAYATEDVELLAGSEVGDRPTGTRVHRRRLRILAHMVRARLAPRRPSERPRDPVPASRDALETDPRRTGTGRQTAAERIAGDGISEELFDCPMGLPHVHGATSLHQSRGHGPLNHAVAETKRPRSLGPGAGAADLFPNTARKRIENARQRWRMV